MIEGLEGNQCVTIFVMSTLAVCNGTYGYMNSGGGTYYDRRHEMHHKPPSGVIVVNRKE